MKLRYFEYRKGRIEIIPMIDVMLFLPVFFIIVTLQMIPDSGVDLALPQSSQVRHLPRPKVTVNLLADGSIQVKGRTLTADALAALLAGDGDPAKTQVTIAADKRVAFQYFVAVMDAARKAGVRDIGVAAQPSASVANQAGADQTGSEPPGSGQPATSPAAPASAPTAAGEPQAAPAAALQAPAAAPANRGTPPAAPAGSSPATTTR
ncbi:MAG TPA: biopolymer transporter ExbD [Acetobacteraceae bacterium]|nr:biopolymer transporter ExbD [Acetobacteraceae bacterium]